MEKTKFKIVVIILLILIFARCDGNYFNVKIEGIVKDSISQVPIENATVNITCWVYSTERWVSEEVKQSVSTDENGIFQARFNKGEAIDITISAKNYLIKNESRTLKSNKLKFAIFLERYR